MVEIVKGDVVIVPFPFSDLSTTKKRPALVVAALSGDDIILCQITSKAIKDKHAISLIDADFESGTLQQESNIRPNRLFTADSSLILSSVGHVKRAKMR
nr:type II toxin-antitoxin system PemK/MazF family toxin [Candidatus Sigynarchaeota archaeon]